MKKVVVKNSNNSDVLTKLVNAAEIHTANNIVVSLSKAVVKRKQPRQIPIIESDNLYLRKQANNIRRISEKMKELNAEPGKKLDDNKTLANIIKKNTTTTGKEEEVHYNTVDIEEDDN